MRRIRALFVALLVLILLLQYNGQSRVHVDDNGMTTDNTYYYNGHYDFANNSFFNLSTHIQNSRGHLYNISFNNLQRCIYDLNGSGGIVQLPRCNITFPRALWVPSNILLCGAGNATVFFLGNGADTHMVRLDAVHNVRIQNIRFDMNNDSQYSTENLSVIYMRNFTNHVAIDHCSFIDGHGSIIFDYWYSPASNVTVENCDFHGREHRYWGGAISFAGHDCIARNNYIEDTWATGIRVHGSIYYNPYPYNNLIEGNTITGNVGHAIHLEFARNNTVTNNIIYSCNSTAYKGSDNANAYSSGIVLSTGNICSGNRIYRPQYRGIGSGGKNLITDNYIYDLEFSTGILGAAGDVISNNYISCNLNYANYPIYGIKTVGSCAVTDNRLICSGSASRFNIALYCVGPGNSTISHNTIDKAAIAIRIESTTHSSIEGNIVVNASGIGMYIRDCHHLSIVANDFRNVNKGIDLNRTHNCTLTANIVNSTSATTPSSIWEESVPSNANTIIGNNVAGCKVPIIIRVGSLSIIASNMGFFELQLPTAAPTSPVAGSCWLNTTTGQIGVYNGTTWYWK